MLQLPVSLGVNLGRQSRKMIRWRHITDRTMKTHFVVVTNIILDTLGRFFSIAWPVLAAVSVWMLGGGG